MTITDEERLLLARFMSRLGTVADHPVLEEVSDLVGAPGGAVAVAFLCGVRLGRALPVPTGQEPMVDFLGLPRRLYAGISPEGRPLYSTERVA